MKRSLQMKNYTGPSMKARRHAKKHPTRDPHWRDDRIFNERGTLIGHRTPPLMRNFKWLPLHVRRALALSRIGNRG